MGARLFLIGHHSYPCQVPQCRETYDDHSHVTPRRRGASHWEMLPASFPASTLPDLVDPERLVLGVVVLDGLDDLVLGIDHDEDVIEAVREA